jgi:hypothetical protein
VLAACECCCHARSPAFAEFFDGGVASVFVELGCGVFELLGAAQPIVGGRFGQRVLEDAGAEVIDVDCDEASLAWNVDRYW